MHFKLVIALVRDEKTDEIMNAARSAGATGASVLSQVRGEGITAEKTLSCQGALLEHLREMTL